jgi:hypothetical protein
MSKFLDFMLLIFLIAIVLTASYFLYLNIPTSEVDLTLSKDPPGIEIPTSNNIQFYPAMRYPDRMITYETKKDCSSDRKLDIQRAFSEISQRTALEFTHTQTNPQITIECSKNSTKQPENEDHFIAGEGGPTRVINTTRYAVILEGSVSFFKEESCDSPIVAIHEILHALGFDHTSDKASIMYPVSKCDQILKNSITNTIDELYSEPGLADLTVTDIKATKSGRYVDFNISVYNSGPVDVTRADLIVLGNQKEIKSFELGEIKIGSTKFLSVTNLAGPRTFSELNFNVTTQQSEIDKANNLVSLTV